MNLLGEHAPLTQRNVMTELTKGLTATDEGGMYLEPSDWLLRVAPDLEAAARELLTAGAVDTNSSNVNPLTASFVHHILVKVEAGWRAGWWSMERRT